MRTNEAHPPCTDCFSGNVAPRGHRFVDMESAMNLFSILSESGKEVFLCQRTGDAFRVCHTPTVVSPPQPGMR